MGTSSPRNSENRSRSPRDLSGRLSQNIPELFRTQTANMMTASSPASATTQSTNGISLTPTGSPSPAAEGNPPSQQQPSLHDLHTIAAYIKHTLSAAITDLRHEIQSIAGRVHEVERTAEQQHTAIHRIHHTVAIHTLQLRDLQRHVEDLDNRGGRHNLRVRGLPETFETEQILPTVTDLFNNLLDRPPQTPIDMERIHRALSP